MWGMGMKTGVYVELPEWGEEGTSYILYPVYLQLVMIYTQVIVTGSV